MKRSRDDLEEHTKRVKYISETPDDWSNLTPEQSKFMTEALNFDVSQNTRALSKKQSIANFMKPQLQPHVAKTYTKLMAVALLEESGSVPLSLYERQAFKKSFEYLGIKAPSRKYISTILLEEQYEKANSVMKAHLQKTVCFQLSLDSWKKNNCNDGNKILAVCAQTRNGSHFVDFVSADGKRMDAKFYATLLQRLQRKTI